MEKRFIRLGMAAALASSSFIGTVGAMESSAAGSQVQQGNINVVTSRIDTTNSMVDSLLTCNATGKFYAPTQPGADANGCWTPSTTGIPANSILAFNGTACPSGYTEYTAARGVFLRGIDNGAGRDPGGTRAPGNYQADIVGPHNHYFSASYWAAAWQNVAASYSGWGGGWQATLSGYTDNGQTGVSTETRPRNVAVLFCQKT